MQVPTICWTGLNQAPAFPPEFKTKPPTIQIHLEKMRQG